MTILRRLWNLLRPAPPICWRCGEPMLDKYQCDECGAPQWPGVDMAPPPAPGRMIHLPPGIEYMAVDRPPRPDTPEPR